ncbi:MAG: hypothetical protein ACU85V_16715 [Gammaproteobacteria bacterium]
MTCCIIALALAWQLMVAWRKLRGWLGFRPAVKTAPSSLALRVVDVLDWFRRPALRTLLLVALALEAGAAGAYVYNHRTHLGNELRVAVFDATGLALDMCRSVGLVAGDN